MNPHLLRPALLLIALLPFLGAAGPPAAIPHHRLPQAAVAQAVAEVKHDPLRFAVGLPMNLNAPDGVWDAPARGLARWRLAVESTEASSLSLRLEDLRLPAGAALRWIGEDSGDVQGPFTASDNGTLRLPLVRDARAVLEARMPSAAKPQFGLRVAEAFHGYRAFQTEAMLAKGEFGNSGDCNIDTSCVEGEAWRRQVRSVVLLSINDNTLCTGTLVNNTATPGRALILTANHCGIRPGNVTTVRAYFNVARPCRCNGVVGPINQNIRAASFLARDEQSDFTVFELQSVPPASFNPFYSGWDARAPAAATPQSGASVHHPGGDDKKISLYNTPASAADDQPISGRGVSFSVDAWRVRWSRGTTEQGSSGAGLFNQDRRIVGVLSGGAASCANPDRDDFYGRLDRAWQASAADSGQLKAHLAPGSSQLTLDGLERGVEPPAAAPCPEDDSGGGGTTTPLLLLMLATLAWRRRH